MIKVANVIKSFFEQIKEICYARSTHSLKKQSKLRKVC